MKVLRDGDEVAEACRADVGPMRAVKEHTHLLGKLAKPAPMFVELVKHYRKMFGWGMSDYSAESLYFSCHNGGPYEIALIFVDEEPEKQAGQTWFCLEEIGPGVGGDFWYMTLDQLIICP